MTRAPRVATQVLGFLRKAWDAEKLAEVSKATRIAQYRLIDALVHRAYYEPGKGLKNSEFRKLHAYFTRKKTTAREPKC